MRHIQLRASPTWTAWLLTGTVLAQLMLGRAPTVHACGVGPAWPPPFGPADLTQAVVSDRRGPREVRVVGSPGGYEYQVEGQSQLVTGMGYNPQTSDLSTAERTQRLMRDFGMMRRLGVNTVFGWDPVEFDGLLLDIADEHDLGVAIPYEIDFLADYRDPKVRASVLEHLLAVVVQYREHPATRMWSVGNETFQRTVPPDWCPADSLSEEMRQRARAMASFLVEAAQAIQERDPLHPVIYREAEEAYLSWTVEALRARPGESAPFIYGVNAYTPRLGEVIDNVTRRAPGMPIFISEFALWDAERGERDAALRELWSMIEPRRGTVIGAAVYVWYTDGPEAVDQRFGLVDLQGRPVDNALDAIAEMFGGRRLGR